ncbi:DNA sulfur modification protein DndB [Metabacillus sp. Hm71]|uniref:DNA sulfur modification protein DndB n=1 Tax=Metabacillus sp. Hm71 TaxID=3450743 RepID=UPI003F433C8C
MSTQIKKDKNEFINDLREVFTQIKDDKKITDKIKNNMKKFRVLPGQVQEYINGQVEMREEDISFISILAEQTYIVTGKSLANPLNTLTEREMKEIKSNFEGYNIEKPDFPYTFKGEVIRVTDDFHVVKSSLKEISFLFNSSLLQWNAETQRESRQHKDKRTGNIIETPKLVAKNVNEIKELTKKGQLNISEITLNARLGTSDEDEELIYDGSERTLTVTKGTLLDVLDGYHRTNGIAQALREDPSIDREMLLFVLNYDKKRAQEFFRQKNTFTVVSSSHLKKMGDVRQADFIAKQVQANSELSGKVAAGDHISPNSDLLLTFNTLSDSIDEIFNITDKPTAIKVSRYLTDFFNELCFSYPDEFLGDIAEHRKTTLINANVMFNGYVQLAKRMYDEGIKVNKLTRILSDIDFSRDNKMWVDLDVLDQSNRIKNSSKKQIIKFFNELKLNK